MSTMHSFGFAIIIALTLRRSLSLVVNITGTVLPVMVIAIGTVFPVMVIAVGTVLPIWLLFVSRTVINACTVTPVRCIGRNSHRSGSALTWFPYWLVISYHGNIVLLVVGTVLPEFVVLMVIPITRMSFVTGMESRMVFMPSSIEAKRAAVLWLTMMVFSIHTKI